jgi:hypothetical protein
MDSAQQTNLRLWQLQSWLRAGGQIEEPVLQRSAYHGVTGRVCIFEVVVNHGGSRRAIMLSDDPAVYTFLSQQHLAVLDVS